MKALLLDGVRLGRGEVLGMRLDPGLHVVWSADADASAELADVLSGVRSPRRGSVRVFDADPFAAPMTRRRIGSLLASEPPLLASDVRSHVEAVRRLRETPSFDELAERAPWLSALGQRPSSSLDARERRLVAAALALESNQPQLVVLHEPFDLAPEVDPAWLFARIAQLATSEAVVVCITRDERDARRIGGSIWRLSGRTSPARRSIELLVRAEDPRALAARLSTHPAVVSLRYDDVSPRDLRVRGVEALSLCNAVRDALLAEGSELFELTELYTDDVSREQSGA